MQLDRTEIVIRRRNSLELLDLSLLVLKRHWRPIAASGLLLGLPFLLLDMWAIQWMLQEDSLWSLEYQETSETAQRWRHAAHLTALFFLQFPLLSIPTTLFLGNQIFFQPMSLRQIVAQLRAIAFRCFIVLGVLRLGVVALCLELAVNRRVPFDSGVELWILVIFPGICLIMRACWPLAPEILGLERCPLWAKEKNVISYRQRSRRLHHLLLSENISSFIAAAIFGSLLLVMLLSLQLWLAGISTGNWQWAWWCDYIALPVSLWCVGLFLAVFRFLNYIDVRIRLEGWEIELLMRAEGARLKPLANKLNSGAIQEQAAL
ncbi:hypothetical protein [Aureliella helgolandensis]|uniref:Uncharacterized protein n=1 Tax=Aureliella helgolandensis TaxID=2527968 RepID=A0A518G164_9BACT|nr:hypothetical protein [Aureliella helgolandensis]QDV22348.1 hypothetical protein Q31a_06320 [Aureliella helgolandensis]